MTNLFAIINKQNIWEDANFSYDDIFLLQMIVSIWLVNFFILAEEFPIHSQLVTII